MYQPKPTAGDTSWFVHDRFGMFIHWGLYALPARHEWVRHYEEIIRRSVPAVLRALQPRSSTRRNGPRPPGPRG